MTSLLGKSTPHFTTLVGSLYTPQYASLEQIKGTGTDPRSDLYAVGATLHHLLTNAAPIDALERAAAIVVGQPDPLRPASELNPQVPVAVEAVIMDALSLDPSKRPVSASAMWDALAAARAQSMPGATVPGVALPSNVPATRTSAPQTASGASVSIGTLHVPGATTSSSLLGTSAVNTGTTLLPDRVGPERRRSPLIIGLIVVLLIAAVGGIGTLVFQSRSTATPEPQPVAGLATAPPTTVPTIPPPTTVPTIPPPTTVPTIPPTALPPTAVATATAMPVTATSTAEPPSPTATAPPSLTLPPTPTGAQPTTPPSGLTNEALIGSGVQIEQQAGGAGLRVVMLSPDGQPWEGV